MTFRSLFALAGIGLLLGAAPSSASAQDETEDPAVAPRLTELTRAALSAPGDSTVWNEMASLLPEMARAGDADVIGAFEAARLADSLAVAPFDPIAVALESGRQTAERAQARTEEPADADVTSPSGAYLAAAIGILPWTLPWLLVAGIVVAGNVFAVGDSRPEPPVPPDRLRSRPRVAPIGSGPSRLWLEAGSRRARSPDRRGWHRTPSAS